MVVGQVADHADVAAIGEAARPAERRTERVVEWEPEREEQGTAPVVRADGIVPAVDERAQDALRDVVAARRELVEHHMILGDRGAVAVRRFLDLVEGAGDEDVVGDATPVEAGDWSRSHWGNLGRDGQGGNRAARSLISFRPCRTPS